MERINISFSQNWKVGDRKAGTVSEVNSQLVELNVVSCPYISGPDAF